MYCQDCGAEIREGASFCIECGAPVSERAHAPGGTDQRNGTGRKNTARWIALVAGIAILAGGVTFFLLKLWDPFVKTTETWTVESVNGDEDQESTGETRYDSRGRIVPDDGGTAQKPETGQARKAPVDGFTAEYDRDGRITTICCNDVPLKEQPEEEKTDENGNLIRQVFRDDERTVTVDSGWEKKRTVKKREKEEQQAGGEDKKAADSGTGDIKTSEVWTYTEPDDPEFGESWSGTKRIEYDDKGRTVIETVEEITTDRDGKTIRDRRTEWTYDKDGLLVKRDVEDIIGGDGYSSTLPNLKREFRTQGHLNLLVREDTEARPGESIYPHRFEYDKKGVPVSETMSTWQREGSEITYTFKRDKKDGDGRTLIGTPNEPLRDDGDYGEIRVRLYEDNTVAERVYYYPQGSKGEEHYYYENGQPSKEVFYAGDGVFIETRYTEDGRLKKMIDAVNYDYYEYDEAGAIKGFTSDSPDKCKEVSQEKDEGGNVTRQVFERGDMTITIDYQWKGAESKKGTEKTETTTAAEKKPAEEDLPMTGGKITEIPKADVPSRDALNEFLLFFSQYHSNNGDSWDRTYDHKNSTGPEKTILSNLFGQYSGAGPCIDYTIYPGKQPELKENQGNDPENWVEDPRAGGGSGEYYQDNGVVIYARYDKKQVDWILKNIFNVKEGDIGKMEDKGREAFDFYAHEGSYYQPYGNTIGDTAGGEPAISSILTDGRGGYCVAYSSESTGGKTCYAVLRLKEIDGKKYWSMYSHGTTPPENLKKYY